LQRRSTALAELLTQASEAHITSALGTDLRLDLTGRDGIPDDGDLTGGRAFGNLPCGEGFIAPLSGEGRMATSSLAGIGLPKGEAPVLTIEGGRLVHATQPEGERVLTNLRAAGEEGTNLAELGIGTNEKGQADRQHLEDEKILGTVHVAFGASAGIGGTVSVPVHLDCVILEPTLHVGGRRAGPWPLRAGGLDRDPHRPHRPAHVRPARAGRATALAAPGSGSSSYGGAGEAGEGAEASPAEEARAGGSGGEGSGVAFLGFIGLFLLFLVVSALLGAWQVRRARKRRAARVRRVQLASAEAADDDPDFAADAVVRGATALFGGVMSAWTHRDRDALRAQLGADLMVEWERRLDDFDRKGWHNVCEVRRGPEIAYVGLVNREGHDDDRIVVRVEATLNDYVRDRNGTRINHSGSTSQTVTLAEYWTLGKHGGRWRLLSIEQDAEGAHHLDAPIVASPWSDGRLRDQAVTELATADAVPDAQIAGLADLDFDGTARGGGARPRAGRRTLRARRARDRGAPRRRGVGRGRRRRGCGAGARRDTGRRARAPLRGRRQRAHAARRARATPERAADHGAARRRHAAGDDRRSRPQRAPLPRGPRHRRGGRGQQGARRDVHRALDDDPGPHGRDALADRRDRRRGARRLTLLAVPNVSEGRDFAVLDAVGAAFAGAELLDRHVDPDHHRAVFTLAGAPGSLGRAVLAGVREAVARIDLTRHKGAHPRVGAVDVAPIVFLDASGRGAAAAEAIVLADAVGHELELPVFLYGALAGGRTRAELRRGGPAGLAERMASGS
jgi:predicted lipid-binding transport protein (Tim44 family)